MILLWLVACGAASPTRSEEMPKSAPEPAAPPPASETVAGGASPTEMEDAVATIGSPRDGRMAKEEQGEGAKGRAKIRREDGGDGADSGPAARSWFPDTFLWMPSIATNAAGEARIPITVPDTLTQWRVLALGHTVGGAQGGAEASFQSSLPAYVELRTPSFVVSGDVLRIPALVVNQTRQPLGSNLGVSVRGGSGGGGGVISVGPGASAVRDISVVAGAPGTMEVSARLGDIDAVVRSVPVRPAGLPVQDTRGGTLAATRAVTLPEIAGGHDGVVQVSVFPGFSGYLEQEVQAAAFGASSGLAGEVYRYMVATQAKSLGVPEERARVLRAIELRAWQGMVRAGRAPDAWVAALLRVGLEKADPDSPAGALSARLDDVIRQSQQPDGLWGLPGGSTVDRALVHAAWCAWNAEEGADGLQLRTGGAFARNAPRLMQPGIAAWALLSGTVEEPLRTKLVDVVKGAIVQDERGGAMVAASGVRPDGLPMSDLDTTAVAALALRDDAALSSELVTWLLAHRGNADAFGEILLLRAFSAALGGEIPSSAVVVLKADGVEVARGTLDPAQPRAPISLRSAVSAGAQSLTLESTPPVAGLAWMLDRTVWVDTAPTRPAGVDLALTVPTLTRNVAGMLAITVQAPSDSRLDVEVGLPTGVQADDAGFSAIVASGQVARLWQEDGRLRVGGAQVEDGVWTLSVPVRGTVSGSLHAAPTRVVVDGRTQEALVVPGATWEVR